MAKATARVKVQKRSIILYLLVGLPLQVLLAGWGCLEVRYGYSHGYSHGYSYGYSSIIVISLFEVFI